MLNLLRLLVLTQAQNPDVEIPKAVSGFQGYLADPFKNADELDRRYVVLSELLEA